ncbi:putative toxin-antitoxin system toxin component, PIN family [Clostridium neonatale]|uniref:putative toxin-antitoxin system toxin component, PIN family n=1 Tax=Clostridium neonatale TaxID=137838 RepID=UPI003D3478A6
MKKLKLVIDTNIFIRGIFLQKTYFHCVTLLELLENENIELVFSQDTIGELLYVIKNFAKHTSYSYDEQLETLYNVSKIFYDSNSVNTVETVAPKCSDMFDDMFLKCYIQGNADYIITDDFKSEMDKISNIKVLESKKFIIKVLKGNFKDFGVEIINKRT